MATETTVRRVSIWRLVLAAGVLVHAAIHLLGVAAGFGLAAVPGLAVAVDRTAGVVWLLAALGMLATAAVLVTTPRRWWLVGVPAVVVSQLAIVSAWPDSSAGTIPNALLLAGAVHGIAADGPWGLRARFRRLVAEHVADHPTEDVLTEQDLAPLPPPVVRYVRRSGAVGRPRVRDLRARWVGRIRATPEDGWMSFTAVQHNTVDEPARFFLMDARKGGLPVDVLHDYRGATATMEGRLLSLLPIVHASGPEMDRGETVTVLNDLCLLAPGALADPRIRWEAVDDRTARATCTVGSVTVGATLVFDDDDRLVDFVSDDRFAMTGDGYAAWRWSTPVSRYHDVRGRHVFRRGEGRWHPPDLPPYTYFEGELLDLELNPPADRRPLRPRRPRARVAVPDDATGSAGDHAQVARRR